MYINRLFYNHAVTHGRVSLHLFYKVIGFFLSGIVIGKGISTREPVKDSYQGYISGAEETVYHHDHQKEI